jgi:hypothetical protein
MVARIAPAVGAQHHHNVLGQRRAQAAGAHGGDNAATRAPAPIGT